VQDTLVDDGAADDDDMKDYMYDSRECRQVMYASMKQKRVDHNVRMRMVKEEMVKEEMETTEEVKGVWEEEEGEESEGNEKDDGGAEHHTDSPDKQEFDANNSDWVGDETGGLAPEGDVGMRNEEESPISQSPERLHAQMDDLNWVTMKGWFESYRGKVGVILVDGGAMNVGGYLRGRNTTQLMNSANRPGQDQRFYYACKAKRRSLRLHSTANM